MVPDLLKNLSFSIDWKSCPSFLYGIRQPISNRLMVSDYLPGERCIFFWLTWQILFWAQMAHTGLFYPFVWGLRLSAPHLNQNCFFSQCQCPQFGYYCRVVSCFLFLSTSLFGLFKRKVFRMFSSLLLTTVEK